MLTFAETKAAVAALTDRYARVRVESSFGGAHQHTITQWQIYVDSFGWGPECATSDEAIGDLKRRLAGDDEQTVDPIEPAAAPTIPRDVPTEPEPDPDDEHGFKAEPLDDTVGFAIGQPVQIINHSVAWHGQKGRIASIDGGVIFVNTRGKNIGCVPEELRYLREDEADEHPATIPSPPADDNPLPPGW